MAKQESAWKQMIHFYRHDYEEQHAPMLYGDVWLKTKSHDRLLLGLSDQGQHNLGVVHQLDLPTKGQHLVAGDRSSRLRTIKGRIWCQHPLVAPFRSLTKTYKRHPNRSLTINKPTTGWSN